MTIKLEWLTMCRAERGSPVDLALPAVPSLVSPRPGTLWAREAARSSCHGI